MNANLQRSKTMPKLDKLLNEATSKASSKSNKEDGRRNTLQRFMSAPTHEERK